MKGTVYLVLVQYGIQLSLPKVVEEMSSRYTKSYHYFNQILEGKHNYVVIVTHCRFAKLKYIFLVYKDLTNR